MRQYSPVPFTHVELTGAFWKERLDTVLARTIPSQYAQLEAHNMIESLEVRQPPPPLTIQRNKGGFTTQIFWDSDIGKWIEAASYALSHRRDEEIEGRIEHIVDLLEKAQLEDGYLNCWYIGREIENRWTNLRDNHELYNAGHLLEGAIAYFQATGRRRFLDVMERYMDHIARTFGPGEGQKRGYPGHQEIELALIRLFHLTGEKRRLELATYFINERGRQPHYFDEEARARGERPEDFGQGTYEYNQSHKPVREQDKVVGHAVRAMYMYSAMADLAAELDDAELKRACEVLWQDAIGKRMYVTAGFGPSARNEGFTADYDLPNDTAYAETCATVAMIFWAQRMLNLDLDGDYADTLELGLYNGALSGLSHGGQHYFYENKLESDGSHNRWAWHHCPCCTMNVSRLIASVGGYFYSTSEDAIAVNLYGGTRTEVTVGGTKVRLEEASNYPWSGDIQIRIDPERAATFSLKLRIPGWAEGARASINGEAIDVRSGTRKGYLEIRRAWGAGDRVELTLPMAVQRIYAHPAVRVDVGKVTLRRGPLTYCLEQADNPDAPVGRLLLGRDREITAEARSNMLGGITVLTAAGEALSDADWGGALYRPAPPVSEPAMLTAVPYYAWNNREPGQMTVWINERIADASEEA
jgi:uncharacterized protein